MEEAVEKPVPSSGGGTRRTSPRSQLRVSARRRQNSATRRASAAVRSLQERGRVVRTGLEKRGEFRAEERFNGRSYSDGCGLLPLERARSSGGELCGGGGEGLLQAVEHLLGVLPLGAGGGGGDEVLQENEAHFAHCYG